MRSIYVFLLCLLLLSGCKPSPSEILQKNLTEKCLNLNQVYANQAKHTDEIQNLNDEIFTIIDDRVKGEVLKAEADLARLRSEYYRNALLHTAGGAGMILQIADEERVRDGQKAILQKQLDGQLQKLALNRGLEAVLKSRLILKPACAEKNLPTTMSKSEHENCSLAFDRISSDQINYLSRVQSLGLGGPQTAAIKTKIAKLAFDEKRAVRVYNDLITKYPKVAMQASALPLKIKRDGFELPTTRPKNPVIAAPNTQPKKKWQCEGWYTNGIPSDTSGYMNGEEARFVEGKLQKFSTQDEEIRFGAEIKNTEQFPNEIHAQVSIDGNPRSKIVFRCDNRTLKMSGDWANSKNFRIGRIEN